MNQQEFFATYAPIAQAEEARSGIPASITLAQAALESGWGSSGLTQKVLNFFGIKTSSSWDGEVYYTPTREEVGGKSVVELAGFRAYDSAAASFADHSDFIMNNSRYKNIMGMTDPYAIADELQRAGYATDSNYASSLKSLIKKYDLTAFDSGTAASGASLAGWKDWLGGINKGREALTPDWWENAWNDIFHGKNPVPSLDDTKQYFGGIAHSFLVAVIVLLLLVFIGFMLYKSVSGIGG